MAKPILSPQAERDLNDIWDYLHDCDPMAALRVLGEINGMLDLIANFPKIGVVHSELDGSPRVFVVKRYLIVYDFDDDEPVRILRVYHASRDRHGI